MFKCDRNMKNPSFKSLQGGMAGLVPDSSLKDFSHTELQVFFLLKIYFQKSNIYKLDFLVLSPFLPSVVSGQSNSKPFCS